MTLDPVYCADGCGRLAETERPTAVSGPAEVYGHTEDGWIHTELVCRHCLGEDRMNERTRWLVRVGAVLAVLAFWGTVAWLAWRHL